MKLFKKILIWTVIITVYLNIGWWYGTYSYYNVDYSEPTTPPAKILAGGWKYLSHPEKPIDDRRDLSTNQILFSIAWPIVLILFVGGSWFLYFLWEILIVAVIWEFLLCTCAWGFLKFLFWVILTGGAGELVKNFFVFQGAWLVGILIIAVGFLYYIEKIGPVRQKYLLSGKNDKTKYSEEDQKIINECRRKAWRVAIVGIVIFIISLLVRWL